MYHNLKIYHVFSSSKGQKYINYDFTFIVVGLEIGTFSVSLDPRLVFGTSSWGTIIEVKVVPKLHAVPGGHFGIRQ